jgi:hypothetical protein
LNATIKFELEVGWPEQKAVRVEMGDKLSEPREILYFSYFKGGSKKSVPEVQAKLTNLGYRVSIETKLLGATKVTASKEHALTDDAVKTHLTELVTIVEGAGGLYDGFVGLVVE